MSRSTARPFTTSMPANANPTRRSPRIRSRSTRFARACAARDIAFMTISTDYVFDGTAGRAVYRSRRARSAHGLRRLETRRRVARAPRRTQALRRAHERRVRHRRHVEQRLHADRQSARPSRARRADADGRRHDVLAVVRAARRARDPRAARRGGLRLAPRHECRRVLVVRVRAEPPLRKPASPTRNSSRWPTRRSTIRCSGRCTHRSRTRRSRRSAWPRCRRGMPRSTSSWPRAAAAFRKPGSRGTSRPFRAARLRAASAAPAELRAGFAWRRAFGRGSPSWRSPARSGLGSTAHHAADRGDDVASRCSVTQG